jgi:hypothetical protein
MGQIYSTVIARESPAKKTDKASLLVEFIEASPYIPKDREPQVDAKEAP